MNEDASMNKVCPSEFVGLDRFEAKKIASKKTEEDGLFVEASNQA